MASIRCAVRVRATVICGKSPSGTFATTIPMKKMVDSTYLIIFNINSGIALVYPSITVESGQYEKDNSQNNSEHRHDMDKSFYLLLDQSVWSFNGSGGLSDSSEEGVISSSKNNSSSSSRGEIAPCSSDILGFSQVLVVGLYH